jgi:hypothetical protein
MAYARLLQSGINKLGCAFYKTLLVGIFYSKQKLAVIMLGVKESIERSAQISYMHKAGRAGSKTSSYCHKNPPNFENHYNVKFIVAYFLC